MVNCDIWRAGRIGSLPRLIVGLGIVRQNLQLGGGLAGLGPTVTHAAVAQLVERVLGKDEVMGPTPISSSFC